jgi:hypothetical protein
MYDLGIAYDKDMNVYDVSRRCLYVHSTDVQTISHIRDIVSQTHHEIVGKLRCNFAINLVGLGWEIMRDNDTDEPVCNVCGEFTLEIAVSCHENSDLAVSIMFRIISKITDAVCKRRGSIANIVA